MADIESSRIAGRMRRSARLGRRGAIALAALLPACVPSGHLADRQAPTPVFDPAAFFAGRTQGVGRLSIAFSAARTVHVEGRGTVNADGAIILDQDVQQGDKPAEHRQWRLRPTGPGRWTGTLSDAAGPVTGEVDGNRLHLRFAMPHGLGAQQWIYLQPGGRQAINRMVVSKWGLPVASLTETITRR